MSASVIAAPFFSSSRFVRTQYTHRSYILRTYTTSYSTNEVLSRIRITSFCTSGKSLMTIFSFQREKKEIFVLCTFKFDVAAHTQPFNWVTSHSSIFFFQRQRNAVVVVVVVISDNSTFAAHFTCPNSLFNCISCNSMHSMHILDRHRALDAHNTTNVFIVSMHIRESDETIIYKKEKRKKTRSRRNEHKSAVGIYV